MALTIRPSGLAVGLDPQAGKEFHMINGHWRIYSTHHANIHIGLLNLLSPDVFLGGRSQNGKMPWRLGLVPDPAGGAYSAPQTLKLD